MNSALENSNVYNRESHSEEVAFNLRPEGEEDNYEKTLRENIVGTRHRNTISRRGELFYKLLDL